MKKPPLNMKYLIPCHHIPLHILYKNKTMYETIWFGGANCFGGLIVSGAFCFLGLIASGGNFVLGGLCLRRLFDWGFQFGDFRLGSFCVGLLTGLLSQTGLSINIAYPLHIYMHYNFMILRKYTRKLSTIQLLERSLICIDIYTYLENSLL